MEVDAELGMDGWPRGTLSRGVLALLRVCGLLMMDPCRREKKQGNSASVRHCATAEQLH